MIGYTDHSVIATVHGLDESELTLNSFSASDIADIRFALKEIFGVNLHEDIIMEMLMDMTSETCPFYSIDHDQLERTRIFLGDKISSQYSVMSDKLIAEDVRGLPYGILIHKSTPVFKCGNILVNLSNLDGVRKVIAEEGL